MGMNEFYGKGDDEQSRALLKEVVESGCMFWDTVRSSSKSVCRPYDLT